MPPINPTAFATAWAAAWNARDLDSVLAHFADDVVFSTPKALDVVGRPTVRGKAAVRAYWEAALGRITHLRFEVVRTTWDPAAAELAIIYDREINQGRDRALELLRFGPSGLVVSGEVFYGVIPG